MLAKSSLSTPLLTAPFYARQSASFRSARPLPVRQVQERARSIEAPATHCGRIEYHFHASAQVHLDDPASDRNLAEAAQGSTGAPQDSPEIGGRARARLSELSVALRLFDSDRRLLGSLSTGREKVAYPTPVTQPHRPPLAARLLRGGALLCFDRGGRRLELVSGLVPSRGSVDVVLDGLLLEQLPMTVLTRLVRLGRFHFARTFKRSFGIPPRGYRICLRAKNPDVCALLPDSRSGVVVPVELVVTGVIGS
jgi:hypothetical protein